MRAPLTRLRVGFGCLALAVVLAFAWLLSATQEAVEHERTLRHQFVAERLFDELERELSALLALEEARDAASLDALLDRPASWEPYVLARARSGPGPGEQRLVAREADVQRARLALAQAGLLVPERQQASIPSPQEQQRYRVTWISPGETVLEQRPRGDQSGGGPSSYDVARKLNLGAQQRAPAAKSRARPVKSLPSKTAPEGPRSGLRPRSPVRSCQGAAASLPLTARVLPGELLVLWRAGPGEAEGLLLDTRQLIAVLGARVVEAAALREVAEVTPGEQPGPPASRWSSLDSDAVAAPSAAAYFFSHRFAAPFDAVTATLRLAPLADRSSSGWLAPLAGAAALALGLGLLALYRMVAVQLRFAQRRQDFVSAVSHELKTPLTAIRMYAEMLRDDMVEDEPQRRAYHATITSETERLSRLIDNVLELSRLERDARPLVLRTGDVGVVAQRVLDVLEPHARLEGFTLSLSAAGALPPARFDADALEQVLFNLLDNATKYARGAADRRIEVRLAAEAEHVVLAVIDHGPGVAPEHLPHIFEAFYRGESELTRSSKGTGIGLALVRGLVTRMHGRVSACNVAGGFQVRVQLPAAC